MNIEELTETDRAEFAKTLKELLDRWEFCVAGQMTNGFSKGEAVEIVGQQMTDFFNGLRD